MSVCRFFQQGRCKFGNECRHSHQLGGSGGYDESNYSPRSDRYHYVKTQDSPAISQDPKQHASQILEMIRQDLTSAEMGGQWPFSCYAPTKEYPAVNGLEDISPEELRWQMYSAMASGKVDEQGNNEAVNFQIRMVQEVLQTIHSKWNILKSQTGDPYGAIQRIFNKTEEPSSFTSSPSVFGGPSIFGGSTSSAPSHLGSGISTPAPSIFGGGPPALPPSGLFAAAAATAQTTSPFFAQPSPVQPPTGLFGAAAAQVSHQNQPGSLFGGAQPQQTGIFGTPSSNVTNSVFGGAGNPNQSGSIFGNTNHDSNAFGSVQQTSVGQGFGTLKSSESSSVFPVTQVNTGASLEDASAGAYSVISDLSETDIAAFKAETFVIGKIPTVPPPRELCFAHY